MNSSCLLENGPLRLKRCRHGLMLYLITDKYVGRSLDLYGEFSDGEIDVLRQLIRPGATVLEVGANIGSHTVSLAKATGPSGSVFVFEPQRLIFQILCANLALNALANVYTHRAAVGRKAGASVVPKIDPTSPNNFGGVSLGDWPEGEPVPVMTIDSLGLAACHLIKIDVEGMESDVIAGAEQTIRRFRPVLYLENDQPEKSAALIRQIMALDYRLYWHRPPMFNAENYFGVSDNIFPGIFSINMLCLHASWQHDVTGLREILKPEDRWQDS